MRTARPSWLLLGLMTIAGCATGVSAEDQEPWQAAGGTGGATGGSGGGTGGTHATGGSGGSAGHDAGTDGPAGTGGLQDAAPDQEPPIDAGKDAPADAALDVSPDVALDATEDVLATDAAQDVAPDALPDGPIDAADDVAPDALPDGPIDAADDVAEDVAVDGPDDVASDTEDAPLETGTDAAVEAEAGVLTQDNCPGEVLALQGQGADPRSASLSATTVGLANDLAGTCAGASSPEAVYQFTPDVDGIATVIVKTTAFDASLYVRTTCTSSAAASQIGCKDAALSSGSEKIVFWATAGSTYFVIVDGSYSTKGAFTLNVTVAPKVSSEQCPGEAVTWIGSGTQDRTATVTGDTSLRWDDYDGSCGSTSTPESVFAFTADVGGQMKLTLTSTGWDGILYVKTDCTAAAPELICRDSAGTSSVETAQFLATTGTTYYAFVDGSLSGSKGPFTLDGLLSPPKPSESCPGEPAVWTGSGTDPRVFIASGNTSNQWNDTSGTCGGSSANDAVYALTPDIDGTLVLEVAPTGWDAVMFVRSDCATSGSELACKDTGSSSGKETYSFKAKAGTTYSAFIDGYTSTSKGAYTFTATLTPALASETCPGEELTLSGTPAAATVAGNTAGMWSDEAGSCAGSGANDAVYHLLAPQSGTMTVKVTPTGWDPVLYVRSGTCAGTEVTCKDVGSSGTAETVNVNATVGTDYWIFVDGFAGTSGAYTLNLHF